MGQFIDVFLLVVLGFIPSVVWLLFYMLEDTHEEPKRLVARTFLMGIVLAPWAVLFQILLPEIGIASGTPTFFFYAALIEEAIKLMVVVLILFRSPHFHQPIDAMIFMIVAALGFAAIENVLYLFRVYSETQTISVHVFAVLGWRFIGATLLHAMASAIVGYFIAHAWFYHHIKSLFLFIGLGLGTLFHFAFNALLVFQANDPNVLWYVISLLIATMMIVFALFHDVKERTIIEHV